MKKLHPTRTPPRGLRETIGAEKWPIDVETAVLVVAAHLRGLKLTAEADALVEGLKALLVRAGVLPVPAPSSDEKIIGAMDRLVLLATSKSNARYHPIDQLAWDMWTGVRDFVVSYAAAQSGVRSGVRKKSTKKARG